jgi:hypothetical protein
LFVPFVRDLLGDIRSGVRMFVTYPMLSTVAILTLGVGIGLSTTVFCSGSSVWRPASCPRGASRR